MILIFDNTHNRNLVFICLQNYGLLFSGLNSHCSRSVAVKKSGTVRENFFLKCQKITLSGGAILCKRSFEKSITLIEHSGTFFSFRSIKNH